MDHLSQLIAVAVVSLVAAISPGPDFFIVLKNSLSYSRRAGLFTTLGVAVALTFHLTYTLVGIGVLIAESPLFYTGLKYIGVAYLFYLGVSSLISSFKNTYPDVEYAHSTCTPFSAFSQGFLTNLLNPKAAFFFISLFSQFIDLNTPFMQRIEYGVINWCMSFGWFLFLAYMVTMEGFVKRIQKLRRYIDRLLGGALIGLGLKLLFV